MAAADASNGNGKGVAMARGAAEEAAAAAALESGIATGYQSLPHLSPQEEENNGDGGSGSGRCIFFLNYEDIEAIWMMLLHLI